MDQGTSQDEQNADDDETVENEVSYFFVPISNEPDIFHHSEINS